VIRTTSSAMRKRRFRSLVDEAEEAPSVHTNRVLIYSSISKYP
jgi:hypothetical protein